MHMLTEPIILDGIVLGRRGYALRFRASKGESTDVFFRQQTFAQKDEKRWDDRQNGRERDSLYPCKSKFEFFPQFTFFCSTFDMV